ncbi:unnamed protein product [Ambrosiozyma monospora]|uniref:Unnamed protein product n=1 Tax=Ambrosiozyma monospora TaxID=43982 RepID=A0ACB5T4J9_AMBMO|nr:unnamed protein product [Ambrosiozyma monospora]
MVATNWQLYDIGQQINEAMFKDGSNSGYVLKPDCLRNNKKRRIKTDELPNILKHDIPQYVNIEIISARQLPKPKDLKERTFDPYVELEFYNGKVDDVNLYCIEGKVGSYKVNKEITALLEKGKQSPDEILNEFCDPAVTFKTCVVSKNGFRPIWRQRCEVKYSSNASNLTFVRFLVKCNTSEQKDVVIGVFCSKLSNLKQGYRTIPIYDHQGEEYIYSSLFVNIQYGML